MYQSRLLGALNEYGPVNTQDGAELISTLQTYNVTQTTDDQGNPVSVIGNFNEYDFYSELDEEDESEVKEKIEESLNMFKRFKKYN